MALMMRLGKFTAFFFQCGKISLRDENKIEQNVKLKLLIK